MSYFGILLGTVLLGDAALIMSRTTFPVPATFEGASSSLLMSASFLLGGLLLWFSVVERRSS